MVTQVITGGFARGDHPMVGSQQEQGALTVVRGELVKEVLLKGAAELSELGRSALIIRVVDVREVVDLAGVDPEVLAQVGVGFHQMAQVDPQLCWGEESMHT